MPDITCPIPGAVTHELARNHYNMVRKEMPSLSQAAWRREAARRANTDYDTFLKAWKKPKAEVDPPPTISPKPLVEPPVTEMTQASARALVKQVEKETGLKGAVARQEAALRAQMDYKTFLSIWKRQPNAKPAVVRRMDDIPDNERAIPGPSVKTTLWKKVAPEPTGARTTIHALMLKINPNRYLHPSSPRWSNNCTSCATTYELRRRGYDVKAIPLRHGQPLDKVLRTWGIPAPSRHLFINRGEQFLLAKRMPEGARGVITVIWKRGGSHIFNWEKVNGRIRYIDAQSAQYQGPDGYMKDSLVARLFARAEDDFSFHRVDNITETRELDWLVAEA